MTVNPYEIEARERKAARIALELDRRNIDVTVARRLDGEGRDAIATLADQRSPSDTTWELACSMLARREARAVREAEARHTIAEHDAKVDADPFVDFPT